jgi:hypothetical protein
MTKKCSKIKWKAKIVNINNVSYAYNKTNNGVYNLQSYYDGAPVQVGEIKTNKNTNKTYYEPFIK